MPLDSDGFLDANTLNHSYATIEDMIISFGEEEIIALSNLDNTSATEIDEVQVNKALADASAIIDSYIQSRYVVPLPSVPSVLIRPTCDIARLMLDMDNPRDEVRKRYDSALTFIKDIAKGIASLPLPNDDTPFNDNVDYFYSKRSFTFDSLADYGL